MVFRGLDLGLPGLGSGRACGFEFIVNPVKLETGLRPNSAGIPYTLLLRIEVIGFPTFRLLLQGPRVSGFELEVAGFGAWSRGSSSDSGLSSARV